MSAYESIFLVGDLVQIADKVSLESFQREWKYHHPLTAEMITHAEQTAAVASVGYYHGGDVLYTLTGIPGVWHEACVRGPTTNARAAYHRSQRLKSISFRQRGLLVCIAIYLVTTASQCAAPNEVRVGIAIAMLTASIGATIFAFALAMQVYNKTVGIFLGILSFVPVIGLVAMLMINGRTNKFLKRNGITVGLFGARSR